MGGGRTPNSQESVKSMESNAKKKQKFANQSGRRRARREAPSGHDGAKNPESSKWPGGHRVAWKAPKTLESADESAGGQAARRVSISEESAGQPTRRFQSARWSVATEWAEVCLK